MKIDQIDVLLDMYQKRFANAQLHARHNFSTENRKHARADYVTKAKWPV